jgi:hypothetical protein
LTKNEQAIAKLKELIAILESNVEVHRCVASMGLGDAHTLSITGASSWSYVYKVEIEMSKKVTP